MDDALTGRTPPAVDASRRRIALWLLAGVAVAGAAGCSLVVMANKMIFGDPTVTCSFTRMTGVDLADDQKKVLVVCTAPEAVRSKYSSISFDVVESVTMRFRRQGIPYVPAGKVLTWMDDNGGDWGDADELARRFEPEFIIHIDIREFAHTEENSPDLLRGHLEASVTTWKVIEEAGEKTTTNSFTKIVRVDYPEHHPIPSTRKTSQVFLQEFINRISTQIAQLFYNHHASETVY